MNPSLYTKKGELRKNPPAKYRIVATKELVPERKIQHLRLPGITFALGPNGEKLEDNPDYREWYSLREEGK